MRVIGIDGSPAGGGRTQKALEAVLAGAASAGAEVQLLSLTRRQDEGSDGLLGRVDPGDAVLFGSPVFRASFASPMKSFLDGLPRGMWGETKAPIRARAVGMVLTGASWHHYLAMNELRHVLAGFFAAHVLSPGLYVPADGFTEAKELKESFHELARSQGIALVELAHAIAQSPALLGIHPQV